MSLPWSTHERAASLVQDSTIATQRVLFLIPCDPSPSHSKNLTFPFQTISDAESEDSQPVLARKGKKTKVVLSSDEEEEGEPEDDEEEDDEPEDDEAEWEGEEDEGEYESERDEPLAQSPR
jgi:hypothetical protein